MLAIWLSQMYQVHIHEPQIHPFSSWAAGVGEEMESYIARKGGGNLAEMVQWVIVLAIRVWQPKFNAK